MSPERKPSIPDVRELGLQSDCGSCFGLCCVALPFAASADFAIDKDAGRPCPNLQTDFRCGIHSELRPRGFSGCTVFDCFGAGQKVSRVTFGGQDWRQAPGTARQMFDVFPVMRQLHELLWYLAEALTRPAARPVHAELRAALEKTERLTRGSAEELTELDVPAHRGEVKTSLGESVARAMGRKFVRVALGGVRDEAEIRGHRRTYVGALPGRIVRAVKEAGSMNPVVLLDEIDKVGSDFRGDPAAALLEVLDPAQNHTFRDHYLEVELDLSDVVFLATANVLEAIPEPLLDRMELVRLDGYTEDEKVVIARDHLLPRQLERAGLESGEVTLEDGTLRKLAGEYTREAGVRNLERTVARLLRKVAAQHELGERALPFTVGVEQLRPLIGRPHHTPEAAQDPAERRTAVPGVVTGLAVTGAGGDVLYVEASLADPETGASGLQLTGQLGDVMKESAHIALSFLRSHGAELELPVADLKERGVHLHVPAGAVPKDGPSAGVTMTTALASLLSGRQVRPDVAMTGEVSLTGRVLPIGGVKQKLLAAHRAGIGTVIIPRRNEPDLDDVPAEILASLEVHPVADVRQVLELALTPASNGAVPEVTPLSA